MIIGILTFLFWMVALFLMFANVFVQPDSNIGLIYYGSLLAGCVLAIVCAERLHDKPERFAVYFVMTSPIFLMWPTYSSLPQYFGANIYYTIGVIAAGAAFINIMPFDDEKTQNDD